jgi:hypothetical protein
VQWIRSRLRGEHTGARPFCLFSFLEPTHRCRADFDLCSSIRICSIRCFPSRITDELPQLLTRNSLPSRETNRRCSSPIDMA